MDDKSIFDIKPEEDKDYIETELKELKDYISDESIFISYASFEKRGLSIPLAMNCSKIQMAYIFRSMGNNDEKIYNRLVEIFGSEKTSSTKLDLKKPTEVDREMTQSFKRIFSSKQNLKLVIDITTFTHETLLMMLHIIMRNKEKIASAQFLYNGAEKYSTNESLENVWLSKGCKDVHSVIGYHGVYRPDYHCALIVLTGFEQERATRLVEILEPNKLFLGNGKDAISSDNEKIMELFQERFEGWKDIFKQYCCEPFQFSCKSIKKTKQALLKTINGGDKYNYIIAPLNTKLSTIAAGLVALDNPRVQLCYSIPETYNSEHYSTPGDSVVIYKLI